MKKTIDDVKAMNMRSMIDILESRLDEDVSHANCVTNLIIAHGLNKDDDYRRISLFILEESFHGLFIYTAIFHNNIS